MKIPSTNEPANFYNVLWCKPHKHGEVVKTLLAENYVVADPKVVHKIRVGRKKTTQARWVFVERPLFAQYVFVKWVYPVAPKTRLALTRRWFGFGATGGVLWTIPETLGLQWASYSGTASSAEGFDVGAPVVAAGRAYEKFEGMRLTIRSKTLNADGSWIYDCELPGFLGKGLVLNFHESVLRPAS